MSLGEVKAPFLEALESRGPSPPFTCHHHPGGERQGEQPCFIEELGPSVPLRVFLTSAGHCAPPYLVYPGSGAT